MDVLLEDGDIVLDHRGMPVQVKGKRELAQRAVIRLAVKRGSLPGHPEFGSRLHRLGQTGSRERLDQAALAAVREALAPIRELKVLSVGCHYDGENSRLSVRVRAAAEEGPISLEVTL